MNTMTRSTDTTAVRRLLAILAAVSIVFSLAALLSPALVSADGNDSSDACTAMAGNSGDNNADVVTIEADAGQVITALCIKSGENSFGDKQHSDVISADGTYGGCFVVEGIGTDEVTVTAEEGCHIVSHVDYTQGAAPSPSVPASVPASVGGGVEGGNPTPSVRGSVLGGVPNTAMAPESDGSAPMILVLLLTISLAAVAYVNIDKVRRVRDDS